MILDVEKTKLEVFSLDPKDKLHRPHLLDDEEAGWHSFEDLKNEVEAKIEDKKEKIQDEIEEKIDLIGEKVDEFKNSA